MSNKLELLKQLSREQLQKRFEQIVPAVGFLVEMFNAKDSTVSVDLNYINETRGAVMAMEIMFGTDTSYEMGFPDELKSFLHDYCTYLCAEKLAIEALLNKMP